MKKLLSFFLASCVMLTCLSASAREKETEISLPNAEKAVDVLFEMDILKGDTAGNLNPEKLLTRAEFATILTRVLFKGEHAENKFSDLKNHWAAESVAVMAKKNIVSGYDNGLFGPDDSVTLAQAVKIVVNLLEYGKADFKYPDDYILQAALLGISSDVDKRPEEYITREEAATVILNALYVPYKDSRQTIIQKLDKKIYYVSADGREDGNGTYENPWNSVLKAAQEANGNAIVIIDGGTYNEDSSIVFKNSGENSEKPLIFRSKYGADVNIVVENDASVEIPEASNYITIENIVFTHGKNAKAAILCVSGNGSRIKNSVFSSVQNAMTINNAENVSVENCSFSGGENALTVIGGKNIQIKGNSFEAQSKNTFCVNGAENINISANSIIPDEELEAAAVVLGSMADGIKKCTVSNNVIYSDNANKKAVGIQGENVTDLCVYNNIVDGMRSAVMFNGTNKNVLIRNNIFMNTAQDALLYDKEPSKFSSDYNCYYNAYPQIMEKNSYFENPYFVSEGDDWRLMNGSVAAGSAQALPGEFVCSDESIMLLDNKDFNGKSRSGKWNMGIYAALSGEEIVLGEEEAEREVMLSLDFKKGADHFLTSSDGKWQVSNGAYWQEKADTGRTTSIYDGGLEWTDYEVSADIESSTAIEGNATGLLFRADKEMKNMYALRYLSNNSLEFVSWKNNSFQSLQRWDYIFKPDTVYNIKVKVEGNRFTFYVNGEKIGEAEDDSFGKGTIGFYCFREVNKYDNLKVVSID